MLYNIEDIKNVKLKFKVKLIKYSLLEISIKHNLRGKKLKKNFSNTGKFLQEIKAKLNSIIEEIMSMSKDIINPINNNKYSALYFGYFSNYNQFKHIKLSESIAKKVRADLAQKTIKLDKKVSGLVNFQKNICTIKTFKSDGSFRKLTKINYFEYLEFVKKTIEVESKLFNCLYTQLENEKICIVLSKIYHDNKFELILEYENCDFEGELSDFDIVDGFFFETTKQNVKFNDINFNFRFDYMFNFKIDLQNFYSSIYTHWLERISGLGDYSNHADYYLSFDPQAKEYIKDLDKYNRDINQLQTNGIVTGTYSSQITQEILSTHIDYEISKKIKEKFGESEIKYTRYVDDYVFYFNDKSKEILLKKLLFDIFNKYDLMINNYKNESASLNLKYYDNSFLESLNDIEKLEDEILKFMSKNQIYVDNKEKISVVFYNNSKLLNRFKNIYRDIENYLENEEYSKAKTLIELFMKALIYDKYDATNKERKQFQKLIKNLSLYNNHFLYLCRIMILYKNISERCVNQMTLLNNKKFLLFDKDSKEAVKRYFDIIRDEFDGTLSIEIMEYNDIFKLID